MKNLYFGSAVAILAMLASCAQDELGLVADKPVSNELAGRKNVGVVTFVTNPETRFDYVNNSAEAGDKMGVYLMDKFRGTSWGQEYPNANFTPFQLNWWGMYELTNYISTNFGYTYDGEGHWVNKQAELIEGNYFATFPRCEEATNRRDLWHQFEGVRVLNKMTESPWVIEGRENVYSNFENSFYVGYEQVYRDDEAQHDGAELKQDLKLYNVSTDAHFVIADYDGGTNYRIKKVSIRRNDGEQVPTLVYVRPETKEYTEAGIQDATKFNQKTARAISQFTNIPDASSMYDYVPYQYAEREPVYEYSFLLPETDGFEMNASSSETEGRATSDRLDIYMTIPTNDLSSYTIEIYADQWVKEGVTRHWEEGVFTKGMVSGNDNGEWTLDKVLTAGLSEAGKTIPMGYLRFDNSCWTPYRSVDVVMNQDHLWEKLNSGKDRKEAITASSLTMDVQLRGESITLDDEVMNFLKNNNITLRFVNQASVNQKIYLTAAQLTNKVNCGTYEVIVPATAAPTAAAQNIVANVTNYGNFTTVAGTTLTSVNNHNVYNFSGNVGEIWNDATINASNAYVDNLHNHATINANNMTVRLFGENYGTINANGNVTATYVMNNDGVINVNAGTTKIYDNNAGATINITAPTAKASVYDNLGYVETKGQLTIRGLKNNVVKIAAKIDNVTASLVWDQGTISIWNGGKVYNNPCANITNQPAYPYSQLIYQADGTLDPSDVKAYNANGGTFSVLEVTNAPVNATLPSWVKEATLDIHNANASGTLALGTSAVNVVLNGDVTILAGKTWTVSGTCTVVDNLYVVVHDGGKLVGNDLVTSDVNYNSGDENHPVVGD